MRGKGSRITKAGVRIGITPAYAGKSITLVDGTGWNEDHPRLCGEKKMSEIKIEPCPGSPPPMRGKANRSTIFCTLCGITPAYAGKRYRNPSVLSCYQDHPRLCGEKFPILSTPFTAKGSPPPMRGKALLSASSFTCKRITPAYAGKSIY